MNLSHLSDAQIACDSLSQKVDQLKRILSGKHDHGLAELTSDEAEALQRVQSDILVRQISDRLAVLQSLGVTGLPKAQAGRRLRRL